MCKQTVGTERIVFIVIISLAHFVLAIHSHVGCYISMIAEPAKEAEHPISEVMRICVERPIAARFVRECWCDISNHKHNNDHEKNKHCLLYTSRCV